jgi:hypothetical protein
MAQGGLNARIGFDRASDRECRSGPRSDKNDLGVGDDAVGVLADQAAEVAGRREADNTREHCGCGAAGDRPAQLRLNAVGKLLGHAGSIVMVLAG